MRWHCRECEEIDLCQACVDSHFANDRHHSSHVMERITTPEQTFPTEDDDFVVHHERFVSQLDDVEHSYLDPAFLPST